jgi:nitrilase
MNSIPALRVAALQMVSTPVVADNLAMAESLIAEAADAGARFVALPEYFAQMSGDESAKLALAEEDGAGPLQEFLQQAAKRHQLWLVGGTIPMRAEEPGKVKNATLVFDDTGRRVARYDKIHLFGFHKGADSFDEAASIAPGSEVVTFDAPCGKVGLSICYDLRFPELFRTMGEVKLIVLPAAFTYVTGRAHWEVLLRARAIENQCYVLASAQGGVHPSGRRTFGDSLVIDPWGEVISRREEGPGVVWADLDMVLLDEVRRSLPALTHRKL